MLFFTWLKLCTLKINMHCDYIEILCQAVFPLLLLLCTSERLERIPWIAPECIDLGIPVGSASDQWSFGATLLEICNNGELPMSRSTLSEVGPLTNHSTTPGSTFLLSNSNASDFYPLTEGALLWAKESPGPPLLTGTVKVHQHVFGLWTWGEAFVSHRAQRADRYHAQKCVFTCSVFFVH